MICDLQCDVPEQAFENYIKIMERTRNLVHSTLDFEELMKRLMLLAVDVIHCKTAAISLREGDYWVVRHVHGFQAQVVGVMMDDQQEKLGVLAMKTRKPIVINDTLQDPRVNRSHMERWGIRSVIVVPLLSKEEAIGAMFFNYYEEIHDYNSLELEFINSLSTMISLSLQNIRLHEKSNNELIARRSMVNKYMGLINSMDQGFCIIDLKYHCDGRPEDFLHLQVNPAFEKQTGLCNAQGKLASELMESLDQEILNTYAKVARTGQPIRFTVEIKALGRWFSIYAFTVDLDDRSLVALLFNNITMEIQEKRDLERSIQIQDEIFTNVSHELKTPLNVIFSTVQLLELYDQSKSPDFIKAQVGKSVKIIKQNCYRFTKLINNIVDLSKMDSGFMKINISNENIVEVVENIVESISDFTKENHMSIIFDTNVEEKIIAMDLEKIERALLNLISNAIKFSGVGGTITVAIEDKQKTVELSVKDTGVGIDPMHLGRIFERFHQVDKTLSRNAEGSGIGLSLVKSIVDMHGGTISIKSELGVGSEFRIALPSRVAEIPQSNHYERLISNKVEKINVEFSDIYHGR